MTTNRNLLALAQSREDRDDARKKKKQRINRKKQIDAAQKKQKEYYDQEREYYKKQDPNAKVYNRDGQEVLGDGSVVVVDDMFDRGPIVEGTTDTIKNLLKYGLPIKSTYSSLGKFGATGLKYLLFNQVR